MKQGTGARRKKETKRRIGADDREKPRQRERMK